MGEAVQGYSGRGGLGGGRGRGSWGASSDAGARAQHVDPGGRGARGVTVGEVVWVGDGVGLG